MQAPREILDGRYVLRRMKQRGDDDKERITRFALCAVRFVVVKAPEDSHVCGTCAFHVLCSFVLAFDDKCRWLSVNESGYDLVHLQPLHLVHIPTESTCYGVQCPQTGIVALSGYDSLASSYHGYPSRQFVCSAHMTGKNGDYILSCAVHAYDGRIRVLVVDQVFYLTNADAESPDIYYGIDVGNVAQFALNGVRQLSSCVVNGFKSYHCAFRM